MGRGAGPAALAALGAILALGAGTASAAVQHPTIAFDGGSIAGFEYDEAYTEGSFDNVVFDYTGCGAQPNEILCAWSLNANLAPDWAAFCPVNGESSKLIWQAGMIGNGHVESGPHEFALRGSEGQMFCLELVETFKWKPEGGVIVESSVTTRHAVASVSFGRSALDKARELVEKANPPAVLPPHSTVPTPDPSLRISSDCRTLTLGSRRFEFRFRRMGCWKATRLANRLHRSGQAPEGYRCRKRPSGAARCVREGNPGKSFGWHAGA